MLHSTYWWSFASWVHDDDGSFRSVQAVATALQTTKTTWRCTNDSGGVWSMVENDRLQISWFHADCSKFVQCSKQAEVLHDFRGPVPRVVTIGFWSIVLYGLAGSLHNIRSRRSCHCWCCQRHPQVKEMKMMPSNENIFCCCLKSKQTILFFVVFF